MNTTSNKQSTNIFQQQKPKSTLPRFQVKNNVLEQLRDVGGSTGRSLKRDLFGSVGQTAVDSMFNPSLLRPQENRPFPESPFRRESMMPKKIEKPREFAVFTHQDLEVQKRITEIRQELQFMIEQLKTVDRQIEKSIDSPMPETGVYYLNYLDRLKELLVGLREEMNSNSWLSIMQSRKKHKGYWAMAKKKQSSFTLNHDRSVATQTG